MSENDVETTEPTPEPTPEPAEGENAEQRNWLYRIAMSGVGAFVLAQEEIEGRLKRLTERGAKADSVEGDGEVDVDPEEEILVVDEESGEVKAVPRERRPIGEYIDATITNILHTVNLPSRTDVDTLSAKIDDLAERVERLRAG